MTDFIDQPTSSHNVSLFSTVALLVLFPLFMFALYQIYTVLQASGTPANIIVDTKAVLEPINTEFLHAFAQGGEEHTDMIAPIIPEVKALHPKYIRIDHIYDGYDIVKKSGNDTITYDWTLLDQTVTSITSTGAIPVLSLSYMPPPLAKDGNITNPPNNWDDWSTLVQQTIEHFSGATHKNLSGVVYEVWNEPDLPQFGSWKLSGEKNYLTLYRYASVGAQHAKNVNSFLFGGPATSSLNKDWMVGIVDSNLRLDFFSWHSYDTNPIQLNTDQKNLTSWIIHNPQYTTLPKFITEFGFTAEKDERYNMDFATAHIAAVTRQIISGGPTYLFSFQLKDGTNDDTVGWGLLTHESQGKKEKPRYAIYNFLDDMNGNRLLLSGEGTWVTGFASTKDNTIRLMLVNFSQKDDKGETVPITFLNVEPGTYTYREHILHDRDVTLTETVTDTSLKKQLFMAKNSVAILELKRQASESAQQQ